MEIVRGTATDALRSLVFRMPDGMLNVIIEDMKADGVSSDQIALIVQLQDRR